jgi:hypothetical protein
MVLSFFFLVSDIVFSLSPQQISVAVKFRKEDEKAKPRAAVCVLFRKWKRKSIVNSVASFQPAVLARFSQDFTQ